ncbi:UV-stimulated scaffold protein A isoform X3 [Lontra canadensis]|uniref:UV-stimulated scaffold protein A isoform X3 n=1 Tax=Lontra canadensis TaxID=76717 RepID=UPI0013F39E70|nr:UV-stimulated scaffold protein A isoform X3 [Lontra canadensis]
MDQKLSNLVEELTTSGEPQLSPEKMKELKKICKSSEEQLGRAYHLLMAQLSQDHAEIRLSAFQAIDELFARSHQFRMLVVSNFQEFLELTLGTDHEQPLPPPREVAQRLRQAATRAIQGWNEKYGAAYKKLALGYHFLRHSKQVDFQDVSARTVAERKREEEKQKRLDRIYREKSEQAIREMEEMAEEIRRCLTEVESCFRLLVPLDFATGLGASLPTVAFNVSVESASSWASAGNHGDEEQPCCSKTLLASAGCPGASSGAGPPQTTTGAKDEEEEEEDEEEEDSDRDSDKEEFVRCHGLGSHKYMLDVELSSDSLRVHEDEDNHAVIQSARDALKLIQNKFLPAVRSWVQLFTRAGIHGGHLEAAIDLKAELETTLRRSEELDIKPEEGHRREGWRRTLLPGACRPGRQQGGTRRRMTPPLLLPSVTTYVDTCSLPRAPEDKRERRGLWQLLHAQSACPVVVTSLGHLWDTRRLGSWQQSGPGHLLYPLGWTCATGARSSRGRSSSVTLSTASGSPARWTQKWTVPLSRRCCRAAPLPSQGGLSPSSTGAVPRGPTAGSVSARTG